MMRVVTAIITVSAVGLLAQETQRALTFDVTSVKPNTSGEQGGSSSARPGRYVGINVTLRRVIGLAYRPMPAFALVLARADGKTGPQLRTTDPCVAPPPGPDARLSTGSRCGGFSVGNGSLQGTGVTMTQLAAELPSATEGRQVIDRTGLTGSFDVTLTWNAEALHPGAAPVQDAASIFAAIQEQLGLRLVSITTPIEVIVIDRAERPARN